MNSLLNSIQQTQSSDSPLPFAVYSSVYEQQLLNVPIAKPLLILVLSGVKQLGSDHEITCPSDHFIFLSDSPSINMRNIPNDKAYFALLIEFDYQDFADLPMATTANSDYIFGLANQQLKACLQQFVETASWAPESVYSLRKKEILALLYHQGYHALAAMMGKPKLSHKVHDLVLNPEFDQLTTEYLCQQLALSESSLRRKLKAEGTSVQEIKDRAKLGLGLHLLQTTDDAIGLIAEHCGYQSQSRFTARFKSHFGLTPSELRKTRAINH